MHQRTGFMLYIYLSLISIKYSAICQPDNPNALSDSTPQDNFINKTKEGDSATSKENGTSRKTSNTLTANDKLLHIRHRTKRKIADDQANHPLLPAVHIADGIDGMGPKEANTMTPEPLFEDCPLSINASLYFSVADAMDFENFTRFWETSVCGDSCSHEHDNVSTNSTILSARSCDGCLCDGCSVYGDCCLDKVLDGETRNNPLLEYTSCTTPTQGFSDGGKEGSYIFVTKCPEDYNDDIIRRNCENRSNQFETVLDNPPVYSFQSKMNYLNSHCAECHNDLDDVTEWTSQITCRKSVIISSITNMGDLINLINTCNCSMFDPPKDSLSRRCQFHVNEITSECNVTGDLTSVNRDLEKACGMYINPVTIDHQKYQNVFCALCNGKQSNVITKWKQLKERCLINSDLADLLSSSLSVPSFSIIFNLRPRQKSANKLDDNKCPEDSILMHKGSCRKLVCSPGRILMAHSCEDAFKTAEGLGFKLTYQLLSRSRPRFVEIRDMDRFGVAYLANFSNQYHDDVISLHPLFFNVAMGICYQSTVVKNIVSLERVTTYVKAVIGRGVSQRRAELTLLRFFESEWEFNNISWKVKALVTDEMPKSDLEFTCRSFESPNWSDIFEEYSMKDDMFIPLTPISRCNQTELSAEEYSLNHTTGLLKTNITGMEYKAEEYIIDGGRARICLNASIQETNTCQAPQKNHLFQINMKWVTTISMGVSICCLCLTIPVCVLAKTRHTLPGQITIALVSTLIIAQLLFITSGEASGNLWGCRFVGMALHYSWLTVFGWKQVSGYHMYVSFVHPFRKSFSNGITFARYMAYAFGVPLAIVVGYTATHVIMSDNKNIGYGDYACFLSSPVDTGVAFVLPVSIVIVSNAFFFGRVVYVIRKMSGIEKHSNRTNTNHSIIFIKMSLLLGFTWVFGFLANMGDNQIIWYTFAVLNAGIGIFVLLGQIWNKRVIGRIRRAMGLDQKSESVKSITNSKSV